MADEPANGLADEVAAAAALSDIGGHAGRMPRPGHGPHGPGGYFPAGHRPGGPARAAGDVADRRPPRRTEAAGFAAAGPGPQAGFGAATGCHRVPLGQR